MRGSASKSVILAIWMLTLFMGLLEGAAMAALTCYDCHGTRATHDNRPEDAAFRNPSSGGFPGNHRTHAPAGSSPAACAVCHPGSTDYTPHHRDGRIRLSANINNSPLVATYSKGVFFNQTSRPILGTCTNVNCHF